MSSAARLHSTRLLAWACALAVSACSALGLDDIGLHNCRPFNADSPDTYEDPCHALNASKGYDVAHDCIIYQCRADGHGCQEGPQDLDGDGFASALCAPQSDRPTDCDDTDEMVFPGRAEHCDNIDNDCDDDIDEGFALVVTSANSASLEAPIRTLNASGLPDGRTFAVLSTALPDPQARSTERDTLYGVVLDGEAPLQTARITQDGHVGENCGSDALGRALTKCAFSDATALPFDAGLLTAAVDTAGCGGEGRVVFGFENAVPSAGPDPWSWSEATALSGPITLAASPADCAPARHVVLAAALGHTSEALAAWWGLTASTLEVSRLTHADDVFVRTAVDARSEALHTRAVDVAAQLIARWDESAGPSYLAAYPSADSACPGIGLACVVAGRNLAPRVSRCGCFGSALATRPALAVAPGDNGATALAWLEGDALWFSRGPEDVRASWTDATALPVLKGRAIHGGPLLLWLAAEPTESATHGRWLLLWTEACETGTCLAGAIVRADGSALLSDAFVLGNLDASAALLAAVPGSAPDQPRVLSALTSRLDVQYLGCSAE